jgi:hypothetical protein
MMASEVTSLEGLAKAGVLRGKLTDVGLPEVLSFLKTTKKTGVLSMVQVGVRKSLFVLEGRVVFAASSLTQDRLGEVLLRGTKISADEYLRISQRIRGGQRLGKVLVETGVLAPNDLWWGIEQQVKEIAWSLFTWDDGYFLFEENDRPRQEKITVQLDVSRLIVEGLRRVDGAGPVQSRFAPLDYILEPTGLESPLPLEPYESHVLGLVDGGRTIGEICQESEIGQAETRKVLHTYLAVGALRSKGRKQAPLDRKVTESEDYRVMVELYNEMYRYLFRHMSGEVGPIAEIILEKYLNDLKSQPGSLFDKVRLRRDGSVDAQQVEKNAVGLAETDRRARVIEALNELLYAELLAVKRTLGASHESQLIQVFRKMRGGT